MIVARVAFFIGVAVACTSLPLRADPRPCPADLDPKTEQKTVKCKPVLVKDALVERAADIREYEDPDGRYTDTYLYCDGNLQSNIFGGSLFRAICWVLRGPEAVVWYKPVPGPWVYPDQKK